MIETVTVLVVDVAPAAMLTIAGTVQEIAIACVVGAQLKVKLLTLEDAELSVNVSVEFAEGFAVPLAKLIGVPVTVKSSGATVTVIEAADGRSCTSPL